MQSEDRSRQRRRRYFSVLVSFGPSNQFYHSADTAIRTRKTISPLWIWDHGGGISSQSRNGEFLSPLGERLEPNAVDLSHVKVQAIFKIEPQINADARR